VRRLGPWRGVTLAALAYALAHAPVGSPLLVAVALLCGIAWGTLRVASGSLVPSLLAHLVWDVLVFLRLPLDSR
jgi:membrane protease YdiL (CAAX protease family)